MTVKPSNATSLYTAELAGRGKLLHSDPCNSLVQDYLLCCEGNYLDLAAVFLAGAFFLTAAGAALLSVCATGAATADDAIGATGAQGVRVSFSACQQMVC